MPEPSGQQVINEELHLEHRPDLAAGCFVEGDNRLGTNLHMPVPPQNTRVDGARRWPATAILGSARWRKKAISREPMCPTRRVKCHNQEASAVNEQRITPTIWSRQISLPHDSFQAVNA